MLDWSQLLISLFSHLDDDVEIHMKAGDVCVQRGTIHGWTNSTDKPARIYFILSGKTISIVSTVE